MTETAQRTSIVGGYVGKIVGLRRTGVELGVTSNSSTGQKVLGNASRFLKLDKARQHLDMRNMQRVIVRKPV